MDPEKYTERARGFVQAAQNLAQRENHQQLMPQHLLKVLLDDTEGLCANLIRSAGGYPRHAESGVDQALGKLPKVEGSGAAGLYLGRETARLFDGAEKLAEKSGDSYVTVERLLLALAMAAGTGSAKILEQSGITPQGLNNAIESLRKGHSADSPNAEASYDALKKYARDLPRRRAKASWIRSSVVMKRSAAPFRSSLAGRKTILS